MATLYTNSYNAAFNEDPFTALDNDVNGGKIHRMYAEYTLSAELADNSVIKFFKLPAGARIVGARFVAPLVATAGVIDIGWSAGEKGLEVADPDGLYVGIDLESATDAFMSWSVNGFNKEFQESVDIQIEATTTTNSAIGDLWQLEVLFVNN